MESVTDSYCPIHHRLPDEVRVLLESALYHLREETHKQVVRYWGKIEGQDSDYHIIQAFDNNPLGDSSFFYSNDCKNFNVLEKAESFGELRKQVEWVTSGFTGDPGFEFEQYNPEYPPNKANMEQSIGNIVQIREENRLSCVVENIEDAISLVPRTSYSISPEHGIVKNSDFKGLSLDEVRNFNNWVYLRPPNSQFIQSKRLHSKQPDEPPIVPAFDFLDKISDIIPPEKQVVAENKVNDVLTSLCGPLWKIKLLEFDRLSADCVALTSLEWPGATVYHQLLSGVFGRVYMGNGLRNKDMAFQMPLFHVKIDLIPPAPKVIFKTRLDQIPAPPESSLYEGPLGETPNSDDPISMEKGPSGSIEVPNEVSQSKESEEKDGSGNNEEEAPDSIAAPDTEEEN